MRYVSTRGASEPVSFCGALSAGYAPDGGLFVPEVLPQLTLRVLESWAPLSFPELCVSVMHLFAGEDFRESELRSAVTAAFDDFSKPEVVEFCALRGALVAELFHGPTLAFKDFGQQVLCKLLDAFHRRRGTRATLLVSTTGDTGPAAIRAAAGSSNLSIVCFYPKGQVSRLQERQMTTVVAKNVQVFAFEGGGDDMDAPIKSASTDKTFREAHGLCSVNSINWGRIAVQTVHWFYAYFEVNAEDCKETTEDSLSLLRAKAVRRRGLSVGAPVQFVVPTGAMGNTAAGFVAIQMGLPILRINCGTNANDIVYRVCKGGKFYREDMHRTISEAINCQVPYNFERILYYLSGRDAKLTRAWMRIVDFSGKLTLRGRHLRLLQRYFDAEHVSDDETAEAIFSCHARSGYVCDPHTAVAVKAGEKLGLVDAALAAASSPVVILATAHPAKFESAIRRSLGDRFWNDVFAKEYLPQRVRELMALPEVGGAPG